jgi:hypothetical protein
MYQNKTPEKVERKISLCLVLYATKSHQMQGFSTSLPTNMKAFNANIK